MQQTFLKYLRLYREFVSTCVAEALTYRVNFVLLVFMDTFFYISTLGSTEFIFNHVDSIGVWRREEFMFFVAFMLAVDQLHMTFISESFWNFSHELRTGKLDFILIKPVATLFPIFFRMMRPGSILNFPVAWGFLIYYTSALNFSTFQWLMLPVMILSALSLLVSIEIMISMSMFWTVESWGINFLRMQFQQLSRWPDFVYRYWARKIFSVIVPVLLIGSIPTRVLMGQSSFLTLGWMILAMAGCWVIIGYLWRLGLRGYESASS